MTEVQFNFKNKNSGHPVVNYNSYRDLKIIENWHCVVAAIVIYTNSEHCSKLEIHTTMA